MKRHTGSFADTLGLYAMHLYMYIYWGHVLSQSLLARVLTLGKTISKFDTSHSGNQHQQWAFIVGTYLAVGAAKKKQRQSEVLISESCNLARFPAIPWKWQPEPWIPLAALPICFDPLSLRPRDGHQLSAAPHITLIYLPIPQPPSLSLSTRFSFTYQEPSLRQLLLHLLEPKVLLDRLHICHRLYPWRKICHVEKFL